MEKELVELLNIENLKINFIKKDGSSLTAIHNASLSIKAEETVCIVGESGSGKTVFSKSIMRLIDFENGEISNGKIELEGNNLTALSQKELRSIRGKKVAMISQEPMAAFDPVFTIGSQMMESIFQHEKVSKADAKERCIYLLRRVGISDPEIRFKQYPNELSGGMLQRVMIAMALTCSPQLLIADEPTTALDVTIQAQILQLLQELKKEFQMSILLITHDMGIASEIADRVIVMYAGDIVEQARTEELFKQPFHPYTSGLLQSITTTESNRHKELLSIEGSIPSLEELPIGCKFHPRCPFATEHCTHQTPPLVSIGNRQVACWHSENIVEQDKMKTYIKPNSQIIIPTLEEGTEDLFVVSELTKYYPVKKNLLSKQVRHVHAVDNVSFSIKKGETFGLVGESGSGKSTLGRLLLQLEYATSGHITFQGKTLSQLRSQNMRSMRKHMQVIHQNPYGSVNPRWTVEKIISEPLTVHTSLSEKEKKNKVQELLNIVGLNANGHLQYPHEFSGGQRQRIAIARAIALNPQFILADEAVSALDVSVQAQIINLMKKLQRERQLTYLFIAHDLNIVRHISDRTGVMYLGQLVEIATSEQLFAHPAHHYTKGLLASIPMINPRKERKSLSIQGEIPSPTNPPPGCRFHTRCPAATDRCKQEQPQMKQIGVGHWVACHHPA